MTRIPNIKWKKIAYRKQTMKFKKTEINQSNYWVNSSHASILTNHESKFSQGETKAISLLAYDRIT